MAVEAAAAIDATKRAVHGCARTPADVLIYDAPVARDARDCPSPSLGAAAACSEQTARP